MRNGALLKGSCGKMYTLLHMHESQTCYTEKKIQNISYSAMLTIKGIKNLKVHQAVDLMSCLHVHIIA